MSQEAKVRPVPTWMVALMLLAAIAGIGTLFADGLVQVVLTAYVAVAAAAYGRDRYRAAKEAQK